MEVLIPVVRAEKECDVYCPICHKIIHLQEGDVIPRCCGKIMEVTQSFSCAPSSPCCGKIMEVM